MNIHAPADGKFLLRFLLIGLVCLGFCLYCLYDGLYAYPKYRLEPALAYEELVAKEQESQWVDLARERGWKETKPKKSSAEARADIMWQFVMAALSLVVGVAILLKYFLARWTWVEADGEEIRTSWGQTLRFDEIIEVDKKRWEKKGIARITFERDGVKHLFVLDDFKYLREPTDRIMERIESRVPAERITNLASAPLDEAARNP